MYGQLMERMLPLMYIVRHGNLKAKMTAVLEMETIIEYVRPGTTQDDYQQTMAMLDYVKAAIQEAQKEGENVK